MENDTQKSGSKDSANTVQPGKPTKNQLVNDEFVMPPSLRLKYVSSDDGKYKQRVDGKYVFEDKGKTLATDNARKETVIDMLTLAKAKGWDTIKVTGTPEFKREIWLQGELQGLRVNGHQPTKDDLALLELLKEGQKKNTISGTQSAASNTQAAATANAGAQSEKTQTQAATPTRPTSPQAGADQAKKNQPELITEAKRIAAAQRNIIDNNPNLKNRTEEDKDRLAYWRGVTQAKNEGLPAEILSAALKKFDQLAADPQFLAKLEPTRAKTKTSEKQHNTNQTFAEA
jgi:hypothetical protein